MIAKSDLNGMDLELINPSPNGLDLEQYVPVTVANLLSHVNHCKKRVRNKSYIEAYTKKEAGIFVVIAG